MQELNKDNLANFLEYYHYFHDSTIINVEYDVSKTQIQLLMNAHWSGDSKVKEDHTYETNPVKMRMIFEMVEKFNNKEIMPWDYISDIYLKYIKLDNKEFICFASDEEDPFIYIVCENIKYEEVK